MKKFIFLLLTCAFVGLTGCAVKPLVTDQFKLAAHSKKQLTNRASRHSIFVNTPDAVAGYQGEEMLYTDRPFELKHFVHSAWVDQPAEMLLPLIVQSLQRSGYFHVVASSPGAEITEYRIDTQLIELHQNFLTKPSFVSLIVKVVLVRVEDNHVVASRIFNYKVTCAADTPYGGVVAANRATELLTAAITNFTVNRIRADRHAS
ncbi:ABC transporter auxiliary component [Legionella lansingensis]|uniref:Transport protein n=1 Tax=Legionella lansingensis TaxID=45067 RepID=A0A0W0VTB3_9GAMM|nr:ABC-type transport auxiliary lipoprotein family protein [Legionella lansingensis]KTD22902.1 transport protein [Legionella lansingensis]SNV53850.1 ABC transporter auxiliary component [Legionella lansingensis]